MLRMENRVYIIGGGLGGLFSGALLTKEGYKVTVFEKNHIIGGGLQTFRRYGTGFETGMHMLGGLREGQSINKICKYLGIFDKLKIRDLDVDCMDQITYASDGRVLRIPEGREAFTRYFQEQFPDEAENVKAYVDALYAMVDQIDFYYLRTTNDHIFTHSESFFWPADQFVAHYIKDEKLRDILGYMNPMYGGYEGHTPAYIHALINVLYIDGPSRFEGNSQQMADALAEVIQVGGGEVLNNSEVTHVTIEERQVKGIEVNGKTVEISPEDDIKVVCSIHPAALLKITDEKAFPKSYRTRITEAPNSYSSFCVYVVFKPETFPYINHVCYYQDDYGYVWNFDQYDEDNFPRGFLYLTPAEENQGKYATKLICNCPMTIDVCEKWSDTKSGHRGPEYEAWCRKIADKFIDKLEQLYPGFRDRIAHIFTSSPLTIRDYYNEPDGALYGIHKDCVNIAEGQVPVFTKVRNLFMTGQNVNLHGFCGVPLTAINTTEAIVGMNKVTNKINEFNAQI